MAPWATREAWPDAGPLEDDARTEVCVIGAGIAGMSVAYEAARRGRSVRILEAGAPGQGETSRTTAHLVNALDRGWRTIVDVHGTELARRAAESHTRAIGHVEEIVAREGIACDFLRVDGHLAPGELGDPHALDDELDAARTAGVPGVERRPDVPGMTLPGPCLRYPRQGQLQPLRYLHGLARAATAHGARLHHHTRAVAVEGDGPLAVRTEGGPTVTADAVVVATNTPFNYLVALHTKQAAYRSYVIAAPLPKDGAPTGLWWDMEDPFHYVRLHPGPDHHDLVIVGGEDHKTGQDDVGPAARYARLEAWARRRFSALGPVVDRWSGQILESIDGLAFIGRVERDRPLFVVTGDSGNGMTHGVLAGILLPALLAGEQHPWAEVYDPTRIRLHALGRFARENLNVAARYASWVAPQSARGPEEVPPGAGAVIRRGVTPIAVYRDGSGVAHERSAVCPHLGCIVAWNAAEQSWDCPCHGSRFDPLGAVVNGPAARPLAPIEREAPSAPADGAARPPTSPLGIDPEGRP